MRRTTWTLLLLLLLVGTACGGGGGSTAGDAGDAADGGTASDAGEDGAGGDADVSDDTPPADADTSNDVEDVSVDVDVSVDSSADADAGSDVDVDREDDVDVVGDVGANRDVDVAPGADADAASDVTLDADAVAIDATDAAADAVDTDATSDTSVDDPPDVVRSDYVEVDAEVANPARGFYWWDWNTDANLVLVKVQLGEYCATDVLDDTFVDDVRERMRGHADAGRSMLLRFNYADDGVLNGCGLADAESIELIEGHIAQLGPVFAEFETETAYVEAGFLGMWGEWNSEHAPEGTSLVRDEANRLAVVRALLAAVPESRQILIRRPRFRSEFAASLDADDIARLGFHNDCFLASDTDAGTYDGDRSVAEWQAYVVEHTDGVGLGGETCRVNPPRSLCETALEEMERLRFAYLHEGYNGDVVAGWEADGCLETIRRSLGYRWVMEETVHHGSRNPGDALVLRIAARNVGWAPVHHALQWQVVLVDGEGGRTELDVSATGDADPRTWMPRTRVEVGLRAELPEGLPTGTFELRVALVDVTGDRLAYRPVFAHGPEVVIAETREQRIGNVLVE